jgi:hypothetical protein
MSAHTFRLAEPPTEPPALELWMQHVAGFLIFEDVRRYAIDRLDSAVDPLTFRTALKAIDDAIYGLMMVIDGVSGSIRGADEMVDLRMHVRLHRDSEIVQDLDLFEGDGMCMGFHGWMNDDFGTRPLHEPGGD